MYSLGRKPGSYLIVRKWFNILSLIVIAGMFLYFLEAYQQLWPYIWNCVMFRKWCNVCYCLFPMCILVNGPMGLAWLCVHISILGQGTGLKPCRHISFTVMQRVEHSVWTEVCVLLCNEKHFSWPGWRYATGGVVCLEMVHFRCRLMVFFVCVFFHRL